MKVFIRPKIEEWPLLLQRPENDLSDLFATVQSILFEIKTKGDEAIIKYSKQFDGYGSPVMQVSQSEIDKACMLVSNELKDAILKAKQNIETFHKSQRIKTTVIETQPGVRCWQESVAIEKVGLYIPGGTAPLFSTVLMLAIPAKIAGCKQIILCTPPNNKGEINPAILYAANLIGVDKIYKIGGVQAIGAMTYGTDTVPAVSKIFGPGNKYVTAAKQWVSLKDVAIDMPAGPSEVLVMADESADAAYVAADLLSQAEHGADSQVIFITTSEHLVTEVNNEIDLQLNQLPRKDAAMGALGNSRAILLNSLDEMIELSNSYAPEHLILALNDAEKVAQKITNAGSVFIGHYTPESAGDYASGTNHTLPTHGYAKAYSGVNLDSFIRKITFQHITPEGLKDIGPVIEKMAEAELLEAHKNAVTLRLAKLNQ